MQTKFKIGDIIVDQLERVGRMSKLEVVDIREEGPSFCKRIWYILLPVYENVTKNDIMQGLQSIVEEPGRFMLANG